MSEEMKFVHEDYDKLPSVRMRKMQERICELESQVKAADHLAKMLSETDLHLGRYAIPNALAAYKDIRGMKDG